MADNIPILQFGNGVTQEYAGYNGKGIKQADVNLLAYPLKLITNTGRRSGRTFFIISRAYLMQEHRP